MLGGEGSGELAGRKEKGATELVAPFLLFTTQPAFRIHLSSRFLPRVPNSSSALCIGSKFRTPHPSPHSRLPLRRSLRSRPQILRGPTDRSAQLPSCPERPVRIPQHLAREQHDVRLPAPNHLLSLR